ncbi:MAG: hypothetical protein NVSMB64_01240 [Candidatus Velthaea sp.]
MNGEVAGVATGMPIFVGYSEKAASPATGAAVYLEAVPIDSFGAYEKTLGLHDESSDGGEQSCLLATAVECYFSNGGLACFVISVAAKAAESVSRCALQAGLGIAAKTTGTILVVPDLCFLETSDYAAILGVMLGQASTLKDRVALLDLPGAAHPNTWTPDGLRRSVDTFEAALASVPEGRSYGAVYAPALMLPSGSVCVASAIATGVCVSNDIARGVWSSPTNRAVKGVVGLTTLLSDVEIAAYDAPGPGASINMLRTVPGRGIVMWGARTLDGAQSDVRYLPIRRTITYLERAIASGLGRFAASQNAEETWAVVIASIEGFLTAVWRAGGLVGTRPSEAFAVKCGVDTITPDDLLAGNLNVVVMAAPLRPAEFVILQFRQKIEPRDDGDPPNP